MVEHPCGSLAFKLLLLQDALKVLHALLRVLHVGRQVAVQETDGVTEHRHARTHTPFITLQQEWRKERERENKGRGRVREKERETE